MSFQNPYYSEEPDGSPDPLVMKALAVIHDAKQLKALLPEFSRHELSFWLTLSLFRKVSKDTLEESFMMLVPLIFECMTLIETRLGPRANPAHDQDLLLELSQSYLDSLAGSFSHTINQKGDISMLKTLVKYLEINPHSPQDTFGYRFDEASGYVLGRTRQYLLAIPLYKAIEERNFPAADYLLDNVSFKVDNAGKAMDKAMKTGDDELALRCLLNMVHELKPVDAQILGRKLKQTAGERYDTLTAAQIAEMVQGNLWMFKGQKLSRYMKTALEEKNWTYVQLLLRPYVYCVAHYGSRDECNVDEILRDLPFEYYQIIPREECFRNILRDLTPDLAQKLLSRLALDDKPRDFLLRCTTRDFPVYKDLLFFHSRYFSRMPREKTVNMKEYDVGDQFSAKALDALVRHIETWEYEEQLGKYIREELEEMIELVKYFNLFTLTGVFEELLTAFDHTDQDALRRINTGRSLPDVKRPR
ncbi:hypothetical protein BJX99DRAFT_254058 [Aspergillus californicus]